MMHESVLDTPYETGLRLLLLLRAVDSAVTCDYLAALDTLVVNAKTLDVGERDLNGTHRLASGEIYRRVALADRALKDLTLRGLVLYRPEGNGAYALTRDGRRIANAMTTPYSKQLTIMAKIVLDRFDDAPEETLINYIAERSIARSEVR